MSDSEADKEAATATDAHALTDRGEPVSLMEPMRITETSRYRAGFADLAVELAAHAAGFRRSLPEGILTPLADFDLLHGNILPCRCAPRHGVPLQPQPVQRRDIPGQVPRSQIVILPAPYSPRGISPSKSPKLRS